YQSAATRPFVWDYLEKYGIKTNAARSCTEMYSDVPEIVRQQLSPALPVTLLNQAYTYRYNFVLGGVDWSTTEPPQPGGSGALKAVAQPMKFGKIPRSTKTVLFADAGIVYSYETALVHPTAAGRPP